MLRIRSRRGKNARGVLETGRKGSDAIKKGEGFMTEKERRTEEGTEVKNTAGAGQTQAENGEQGAKNGQPENGSQRYYNGQPGNGSQGYYNSQPGNGSQGYYNGQPGNGSQGYFNGQPGNSGQGYYNGQPGNGGQGYYNGQPGNGGQGYYNGQPGNGSQGYYNGQPGNGGQGYYNGQPGYNGQGSYRGQPGYAGGEGYQNQGGYGQPPRQGGQPSVSGKRKKTKKKRKKWLFAVELLVLLILAVGLFGIVKLGKLDRMSLKDIITNEGAGNQSGYQNIVIYGVDSREGKLTEEAHSDTIIICSINKKTKDIKMVSVYRDTYLDNTNGEYRKATECYYFGGPERSINMLNKNLDLDIKDYVTVDFNAVVKAVDLIGGIDMEITDEELQWLNGYCVENSAVTGVAYTPLQSSGYQHLDGIQTLAYCRIRYTAGYDFKRTERQREVLTKIFDKAKSQGVTTLLSLADTMLPYISTSLSNTELIGLVSGMGSYSLGESTGFPFDQVAANIDAGDCVVPVNLAWNVTQLHAFLFGTEGYTPSQTVQDISNQIIYSTGIQ